VLARSIRDGEYRYQAGAVHWMLGDAAAALACCEQAPEIALSYLLMEQITLPGPSYYDLLSSFHKQLQPRTYIEIGVFTGARSRWRGPKRAPSASTPSRRYASRLEIAPPSRMHQR